MYIYILYLLYLYYPTYYIYSEDSNLLKKRLGHRCFVVNFAKFLRTPFLTVHLWGL